MKRFFVRIAFFGISALIVLELFFRFALPASHWPRGVFTESGIRKFDSGSFSAGRFTYGRYCRGRYRWQINSQGWNSVFEYRSSAERNGNPMVAILGDSYLEGFYSDADQHIDSFLSQLHCDSVSFYTFAMSGGFLSHYIALMKYEIEQYDPDGYIVFLNSEDVSKSIVSIGGYSRFYFQYDFDDNGVLHETAVHNANRSSIKDILLQSAVVRYLKANAQVSFLGAGLADDNANFPSGTEEDSTLPSPSPGLIEAAAFLLSELNGFGRPVIIVFDCPKNWIYEAGEEEAYSDLTVLSQLAADFENISIIELADYYPEEFNRNGRLFSSEDNPHWNAYANSFIADVVSPYLTVILDRERWPE